MSKYLLIGLISIMNILGCSEETNDKTANPTLQSQPKEIFKIGQIYADNKFDGARFNEFSKTNDSTYQIKISPENTPVNNSPWYAFRVWSKKDTTIDLEIAYSDDFKNRYIPKLSDNGTSWKPLGKEYFEVDTIENTLNLKLTLTSNKLWVSAQEIINSNHISNWLDSLAEADYIKKEEIGQSVLDKPINLLTIDEGNAQQSLILIGRQHPPEVPGGTIALISFVETILSNSEIAIRFRKKFKVLIFPLLNPDGVDLGNWRHNANGVDLNRDWIAFTQPETKAVKDWMINMRQNNPKENFCFGIDFHTSHTGPYLLTLDTIPHKVAPDITTAWIQKIKATTKDSLDIRPRAQSLPYCYNWLINELNAEAVTYEEGDEIDRNIIRIRAEAYSNILMEVLLDKYE